jgi:hypothetical protein
VSWVQAALDCLRYIGIYQLGPDGMTLDVYHTVFGNLRPAMKCNLDMSIVGEGTYLSCELPVSDWATCDRVPLL